ncbi:hypothetical protein [Paenibacillus aestuarii]|uniref:Uncharacterized protein n=1 Tax=Paenibacillus aestuarii TaxID=516965 RepID=A0ABW0K2Z1_9BACL|nr:hypothetical protein [Paenibacillus aestuarii]
MLFEVLKCSKQQSTQQGDAVSTHDVENIMRLSYDRADQKLREFILQEGISESSSTLEVK